MELSWPIRLRIGAVIATGVVFIGILAWPLAAPPDPLGAVQVSNISLGGAITLVLLALSVGFVAYFLSWPYGREIGVLAVPSGLAVWALRSGSMAQLMQLNPTLSQRQALFAALKWEPFFWLLILAAGFVGVQLGRNIRLNSKPAFEPPSSNPKSNTYLNGIVALVGTGLITQLCISLLAQDVKMFDHRLGSVVAQPAIGQIVFAITVSFALAAFAVKKYLNASYICPIIACGLVAVTAFFKITYIKHGILKHLVQSWPATFFSNPVICILPLQMMAFGTLASIAGYWLAVRYTYRRKHEPK